MIQFYAWESKGTAHTFSVGIVNSQGQVLSLAGHTYSPDTGGLTPQKVVEHHYAWFEQLLTKAITDAGVQFSDIQLIAFSRGPGLGPCLRIGAGVARSLALKLQIPLVGVNHCIAHVEIGRLMCHVEDPLTLYVSGGNTIVSAFDCGKYQIFGETLDLAIGNMLDMVSSRFRYPSSWGTAPGTNRKKWSTIHFIALYCQGNGFVFFGDIYRNESKNTRNSRIGSERYHRFSLFIARNYICYVNRSY